MPAPQKTFNRGFTTLFADGVRAMWLSTSGAKGNGEEVGHVLKVMRNADGTTLFTYMPKGKVKPIENGDGLCFYLNGREIAGARASLCKGNTIYTNESFQLERGAQIFRNLDIAFEREIKSNAPKREIPVNLHFEQIGDKYRLVAEWEYGRIDYAIGEPCQPARNRERAEETLKEQLSKSSGRFSFNLVSINCREVPFFPISLLNGFRRAVAALAAERIEQMIRQRKSAETLLRPVEELSARVEGDLTYLANVSNSLSREFYALRGAGNIAPAYELERAPGAELMRTKYCLRYELGICPNGRNNPQGILAQRAQEIEYPLYLRNGGTKLQLSFDCKLCEMRITTSKGVWEVITFISCNLRWPYQANVINTLDTMSKPIVYSSFILYYNKFPTKIQNPRYISFIFPANIIPFYHKVPSQEIDIFIFFLPPIYAKCYKFAVLHEF